MLYDCMTWSGIWKCTLGTSATTLKPCSWYSVLQKQLGPLGVSGIVRHEATGSSIIYMLDQIGILRGWRPWHCPVGDCRCLHMLFLWVVSVTYQDRDYCYLLYLQGVFNVVAGSCILLFEQYTFVWNMSHDSVIICIHDMHDSMQTHIV